MHIDCGSCIIRSWQIGDEQSLAMQANNYAIWQNLRDRFPHPYTMADAVSWISLAADTQPQTNFAIEVAGKAVGGIGLELKQDVERVSAELGYWLGEAHWGKGIVSSAIRRFTAWAIPALELTRVYALPFAYNTASCRVLEKAGYLREGYLKRSAVKEGVVVDQVLYAFTDQQLMIADQA